MPALTSSRVRVDWNAARYMGHVDKFPMLAPETELALSRRWREHSDVAAMHRLVTSHLRLVVKIAIGHRGYGLPLDDLIAEGNLGMMRAVKGYDPDRGFRLATYAKWWIRAAIQEYILRNWSLVKIGTTAAQKKLFFNLRRCKRQLQAIDDGELPDEMIGKIAVALDVAEADVISMNQRLAAPDHSLNAPLGEDGGGEWQERLVDPSADQECRLVERDEVVKRRKLLGDALRALMPREQHIVCERWLREEPATFADLSERHSISRERVRQIEVRALDKLHKAVRSTIWAA